METTILKPIFYSLKEVASLIGLHPSTVWRMSRDGAFKTYAIGKKRMVKREDLQEFIERNEVIY